MAFGAPFWRDRRIAKLFRFSLPRPGPKQAPNFLQMFKTSQTDFFFSSTLHMRFHILRSADSNPSRQTAPRKSSKNGQTTMAWSLARISFFTPANPRDDPREVKSPSRNGHTEIVVEAQRPKPKRHCMATFVRLVGLSGM
jgi:hypothetical protein